MRMRDPRRRNEDRSIPRSILPGVQNSVVSCAGNITGRIEDIQSSGGRPVQWVPKCVTPGLNEIGPAAFVEPVRPLQVIIELQPTEKFLRMIQTRFCRQSRLRLALIIVADTHFGSSVERHVQPKKR